MSEQEPSLGRIEVSLAAVASIANEAVLTCYGVVGTAAKDVTTGIIDLFSTERKRGIQVRVVDGGQIVIDIYVVIEYGTRIVAVTQNVMNAVKFAVERSLGVPVAQVNVHVEGLRVSDAD